MSAYTTLRITRRRALEELFKPMMEAVADSDLERFLDATLKDRLYNARIVGEDDENDNQYLD